MEIVRLQTCAGIGPKWIERFNENFSTKQKYLIEIDKSM